MAIRRMISKRIYRTDLFLDMPQSAQNLYTHLNIEADDDGFVNPKLIMRTLGSTEDDLRLLIAKGYVLWFDSGVVVIADWHEMNYVPVDRYKPTRYQKEWLTLAVLENVYILSTQGRLELGKGSGEGQGGDAYSVKKPETGEKAGDKRITELQQGIINLTKDKSI